MSSRSSSWSSTRSSTRSMTSNDSGIGSEEYRFEILEPNNILIEKGVMSEERWSAVAFSLGMPARQAERLNFETQRLTQKMKKRRNITASQTLDLIKPFVDSIVGECSHISAQSECRYLSDAVPTNQHLRNTTRRLGSPEPSLSLGYHEEAFSPHHHELQHGIIMDLNGEPCDLDHISQPSHDHFWPFFVVEVSDKSLAAAQQASAVTTATCNNALTILGAAATDHEAHSMRNQFKFDTKSARSFSLSIHGKIACLSTTGAQGLAPFVSSPVSMHKLDNESQVASLAGILYSIMVWAEHHRLSEITASLDALGRRVHGDIVGLMTDAGRIGFDPFCPPALKQERHRRPVRIKSAFKAGLPRWMAA